MNKKIELDTTLIMLALMYLTLMVASTSVAYKPVKIGAFEATSSSLLFAITFSISSIIAEVYGSVISRKVINRVIVCGLFFSVTVWFMPHLPSPSSWHHQADYDYVFGHILRFAGFGTLGSLLSYYINTHLIRKWKAMTGGKYLPLRIWGANIVGEFFLVTITTLGAFTGIFERKVVLNMLLFAFLTKIFYSFVLSWPSALIAGFIKKQKYES